jgi:AraC-like DNA-binding protein
MPGGYSSVFDQAMILRLVIPDLNTYPRRHDGTERGGMTENFEERLGATIAAYHDTGLLYAAVTLGLPERLGARAWTADALAAELGLSPPHLHRVLRGLASLGICAERPDGTFALTPEGRCLLPGARLREKAQIVVAQYWWPWANLASTIKTGKPAFEQLFGANVLDWRRDHAQAGALFDSYVAKETLAQASAIVAALDFSRVGTVADIGGGYGGLLAAILKSHPDLDGVLFDRPHRIEAAEPFLQSQGVATRVQRIGGDLLAAIPIEADLYLLNGVLQQHDAAEARAILAHCRKAMPEKANLAIVERLLPEHAADDPATVMLDLHMMTITGGRARSLEDFAKMLSAAGLTLTKVTATTAGLAIIEAGTVPSP